MNSKDDGADYEVDLPGGPAPADAGPHDDDDLLADLPPMPPLPSGPPKPEGPEAAAGDPGQQPAGSEDDGSSEPPDLEALYSMAQGIMPEHGQMIETMAAIHARWRKAWRETGEFTDAEAFELARIIVAAMTGGIRSLD